jgi:predicted ATPase/class 3 adenylate cyclase
VKTAALPTGTVAFLFTDIEGSTRRWDADSIAMRDALRRHDSILRFEIERQRGHVFKTIGDAFCAAFWSAAEALAAAVEIQRRLGREDFSQVGGLAVRIAIHAGESDERDGDYFGAAVNRTARLLSAGHGGQILLSGFAAELAMQDLPAGVVLRHLGTLPLRDLKQPESVFQPIVAGLPSEFKPLRALETPPNNLPRQTTSFVGRRQDVRNIDALLDAGGLATLVGPGGIGKTRLALEVAATRLNAEPDGAWFVDLASITDAGMIVGTILSALGATPSPGADPHDHLVAYLQKRELLLLLDNSEHLVAEVAALVARVIASCPLVTILATSREPLDITGERVYRLSSLDLASAVQLFGERARAVNQSFQLEAKARIVENICERLDGIALAIELAAARVRTMPVENVASHLELRLLAGGRDRRPRQQTMHALIDWSYDLLAAEEQAALRRCGVFVRSFTLDAASQVCAFAGVPDWQVLELLASLVDKSLVIADAGAPVARYRILEPIREYAAEKLAQTDESPEALRRHAGAFADAARAAYEEWERGPAGDWLARLQPDLANFRVALRWTFEERNDCELGAQMVADASLVFLRLGLFGEGAQWCERVLSSSVDMSAALEARLRYGLSMLYSNLGANKEVLEQARIAAQRYRDAGDTRGVVRALSQVASRYAMQSRYDEAEAAAEEALRLARATGDRRLLADALRRCADSFVTEGSDRVRALYRESAELFASLGRGDETARALEWWGKFELEDGSYEAAAQRLLEAAELDQREASQMFRASDIACCYLALGDRARAEPFARQSLEAAAKANHPVLMPLAIAYIAMIRGDADPPKAARLIGYAQDRLNAAGWELLQPDAMMVEALHEMLARRFAESELARLRAEGAAWDEDQAVGAALDGL